MNMLNKTLICLLLFSGLIFRAEAAKKDSFGKQLFKNINLGWDVYRNQDYRSSNIHLGSAYERKFAVNNKASWRLGYDFNWSKYSLYDDGKFFQNGKTDYLRTRSLSFPFTVGYDIKKTFFTGLNVYAGPSCELILASSLNKLPYSDVNNFQLGWKVGARFRFLAIFSARICYNYYPTSLIQNKYFNRSNISFSLGF